MTTTEPILPSVTVTGQYRNSAGQPMSGSVSFTASTVVRHAPSGSVVHPQPVTVTLDEQGVFAVVLVPTDHREITPRQWRYRVVESIGPDAEHLTTASYTLRVPHDAETVDLSRVTP